MSNCTQYPKVGYSPGGIEIGVFIIIYSQIRDSDPSQNMYKVKWLF